MLERFAPLPGDSVVFRFVDKNSYFLPADAEQPLPGWFEPSKGDVEEGQRRGRPPGLSVWDRQRARVEEVRNLVNRPQSLAFGLKVEECVAIGQRHGRQLAVVADSLDERNPAPGWDAHALIEGLKRPPGTGKREHQEMLSDLVRACQQVD